MGARIPFLSAESPMWGQCADQSSKHIVEVSTVTSDDDWNGVGSSPFVGDLGKIGIKIPTAATESQSTRYLARLCGVEIPSGYAIVLRGVRQYATIRAELTLNGILLPLEAEITSPGWSFIDGNISWHLRHQQNQFARHRADPAQTPGTDPMMQGLSPALLYDPTLAAPYVPPNGGRPPGNSVYGLGTWRDMRYPWTSTDWTLSTVVRGPGSVVFYASVHQTDPDAEIRPVYPDVDGMRPEDRFVSNFIRTAVYGRVAGSMIFELLPCVGKPPESER